MENIKIDGFENIYKYHDKKSGLTAYISIHNSKLGPALGGTRFYPYLNEQEAIDDVLNLSKSMTYKCSIAGIRHGGGKGVIMGDPAKDKNKNLLKSYAEFIDKLQGSFYTGEDVGLTESDVQYMLTVSPFFIGKSNQAGDPSEYASLSVYKLMKAGAQKIFGTESLAGKKIGIKGLGKVGLGLMKLLSVEKAIIIGTDLDKNALLRAKALYPSLQVISAEQILSTEMDIYAPCALGNEFTLENVSHLKARLICGGANNQILEKGVNAKLYSKNILYIPDYLANAGGLINVADELEESGYSHDRVIQRIENLVETFEQLYKESVKNKKTLLEICNTCAEGRLVL